MPNYKRISVVVDLELLPSGGVRDRSRVIEEALKFWNEKKLKRKVIQEPIARPRERLVTRNLNAREHEMWQAHYFELVDSGVDPLEASKATWERFRNGFPE